ncbi:MAG: type II toxin-antitoxin system VapC family toxin [Dehalococcoidia bacterium]|nr:type II toxin-antitoxin system VapC family toxin [Dehalococcoidia bacterium]
MPGKSALPQRYVLDAYSLLAYFFDEPGGARVRSLVEAGGCGAAELYTCVINFAETLYWTQRRRGSAAFAEVAAGMSALPIRQLDIDQQLSVDAARVKASNPLALADCYAVALAVRLDATLVTAASEQLALEPPIAIERIGGPAVVTP